MFSASITRSPEDISLRLIQPKGIMSWLILTGAIPLKGLVLKQHDSNSCYLSIDFQVLSSSIVWFFGFCYAMDGVIRNETLIETDIAAILVNCFRSRTN